METADFLPPHMQPCQPNKSKIHFTPVKTSNVPRVWDRKPSTSFLARSKPRKVWKRFRSSFHSMKALQQLIAPDANGLKESELLLEINTARNTGYCRGVKRQCLVVQKTSAEDEDAGAETPSVRGRSFLETKWESELSRKRRKLPATTNSTDEHAIVQVGEDDRMTDIGEVPGGTTSNIDTPAPNAEESGESPTLTPDPSGMSAAYPDALHGEPGRLPNYEGGVIVNIKSLNSIDQEEVHALKFTDAAEVAAATDNAPDVVAAADEQLQSDVATLTTAAQKQDTMAVPEGLTAEQESTLVRSALRSSLDGDDTAVLSNFLSKAKARREAKAAAEAEAATTIIAADPEEKEQTPPRQQVFVEIPTPERRILEDLDANSSSPQKSPSKSGEQENNTGENGSASPVARRSTRVRSLQRAAAPTGFRTTLSLRRARGNEFVFLQRTEAQELALLTRRNTKQNKGDALLPKYTLQGLARETSYSSPPSSDDGSRKQRNRPKKFVSWNDDRLAQFEGEESEDELTGEATTKATKAKSSEKKRAASSRNSQSQASLKTGGETAAAAETTASPTAAPRGRRVRRLGPPKPLSSTSIDSSDAASSLLSPTTASPIAKRKKLTPKLPRTATRTASKVPTPVATNINNEVPSLLSGGRSVKTNLLKVNAGSTPMPRRVRRA
ncbi:hypothetical protein BJX76DRAFT_275997 [Aspergillus varians]